MFFNADDDDQDFTSPGGSKLANIFGMDRSGGGNESLTYTAPKQPKKKDPAPEGGVPAVVVASVVTAYKYVENNYASQGKLGVALLANRTTKDYRILLYVNKQQQVTNAKITPSFTFTVQNNNYAIFYDDARQTWSIMFDSADNASKFAREMALAKANAGQALTELIQQDLVLGDGGGLEQGDSVEVKYTGWLYSNGALGKVFDQSQGDHLFRFKVGKGKVIKGWDQGMLGMKKGGKRLLVIPPGLAYGSQGVADRIPPNSALVFEVEVIRVKLQKGEATGEPVPAPVPSPGLDSDHDFDDTTVKGRTRSINEQLSHPNPGSGGGGKSKLISRMAKMGQPMLPMAGAIPAEPEDSDDDGSHHPHSPSPKPSPPAKPRSRTSSHANVAQPVAAAPVAAPVAAQPAQPMSLPGGVIMVGGQPMVVDPMTGLLQPQVQQQQQQPAFLQNLPGAQQLAVYQNPNMLAQHQQQQQQQQQQQLLQQQQQQLLQQQMLGQTAAGFGGGSFSPSFVVPMTPGLGSTPSATPATPSSQPADSTLAPALLSESRQQNTEVRLALSKVSDKVDKVLEKIEQQGQLGMMAAGGALAPYGSGGMPAPSMEANVLMQNIVRIVQENERLKKEVYDQSNKVQELNDRMANLLEKNQKYVEQSQSALEQRNEGYKATASQSQARVLALEQEKVHLATELSTASSQISTLQLELAEFRRREGELKQKLQSTATSSSTTKEEVERLSAQRAEDEQKIETLSESLREQKTARKTLEAKLASSIEELADLKSSTATLEKSLSDRKRKAAEERRKLEEDMEDAKISYEQTIESLRERLRKQKKSVDAETENKVSQIEDEISRDWQAKSDKMLAAAAAKHARQLEDVMEEKSALEAKLNMMEKKLEAVRSSGSSSEQQITQLQDELSDMRVWKEKYDNLRAQATSMKDKYEERIRTLEDEQEESESQQTSELQSLRQQLQQARSEARVSQVGRQQAGDAAETPADVASEVKKVMNSVYQTLRAEFEPATSYTGGEVMGTVLTVIKDTTIKLTQKPQTQPEESDEEEEDEEAEEEEEEEAKDEVDEPENEAPAAENKEEPTFVNQEETVVTSEVAPEPVLEPPAPIADSKEDATQPQADSRSSEGTGSDFEMVSESGIEQETEEAGQANATEKEELEEEEEQPSSSGEATPVKEIGQGEAEDEKENMEEKSGETEEVKEEEEVEKELDKNNSQLTSEESETAQAPDAVSEQDGGKDSLEEEVAVKEDEKEELEQKKDEEAPAVPAEVEKPGEEKPKEEAASDTQSESREPPPILDEEEEDESPLFGKDDTVSDTFGIDFTTPKPKDQSSTAAAGTQPAKKVDLMNEEDLKPQPPPPLFGDDSDDDDLDWLS